MINVNLAGDKKVLKESIIESATQRQELAADVSASTWVSASAGTGKTYVLTGRILRLFMADHALRPEQILAVTFTKAAAREMENRIRSRLGKWATCSTAELVKELRIILKTPAHKDVEERDIRRARSLFSLVLDEGININTIHGFCQQILARFPLEVGISPGFSLMEDSESTQLLQAATSAVFSKASEGQIHPQWAFSYYVFSKSEGTVSDAFSSFARSARRFRRLFDHQGGLEGSLKVLANSLQVADPHLTPEGQMNGLEEMVSTRPAWSSSFLEMVEILLEKSGKRGQEFALAARPVFQKLQAGTPVSLAEFQAYESTLLNKDGTLPNLSTKFTKKVWEAYPHFEGLYLKEVERIGRIQEARNATSSFLLSASYLYLGEEILKAYEQLKKRRNVLDFEDLIHYSATLLGDSAQKMWVQYRLDSGISHILLDEAQDTDSDQWGIVKALVLEFYAGKGQHENKNRTFFAVGDMKQSIYRFRGAEPHVFSAMRQFLEGQRQQSGHAVNVVELNASFRSSEAVLGFVDRVFAQENRLKAVDDLIESLHHRASHVGSGGVVELWPLTQSEEDEDGVKVENEEGTESQSGWQLPSRQAQRESARSALARHVALSLQTLFNSPERLASTGRSASAGDVMILLRSRRLMGDLITALDELGIPHSGADEINLQSEQIVEDLLALLQFMETTSDDLSLAQVLKSPLIGLSEDDFYQVCSSRQGGSLWAAYYGTAKDSPVCHTLKELLSISGYMPVYETLMHVLCALNVRQAYKAALSGAARAGVDEVLDALLDYALAWQRQNSGTLTQFVDDFKKNVSKQKKPLEAEGDRVRLLTAHGSKGLEAPIVIMPDCAGDFYKNASTENALWQVDDMGVDQLFLHRAVGGKMHAPTLQTQLQEAEKERIFRDEMRLLYVALTRAKERLYIGGIQAKRSVSEDTWYHHIKEAILADEQSPWQQQADGTLSLNLPHQFEVPEVAGENRFDTVESTLPAWVYQTPAFEKGEVVEQASSALHAKSRLEKVQKGVKKDTFKRGKIIHKLLEMLPKFEQHEWEFRALAYLEVTAADLTEEGRFKLYQTAENVILSNKALFGENSRAEVPLFAKMSEGKRREGVVDRLVVQAQKVWVVDYKTDIHVPSDMPAAYIRQLETYRQVLAKIFPEKEVKAGILWTSMDTPKIVWL